jgi:hypothetical protein
LQEADAPTIERPFEPLPLSGQSSHAIPRADHWYRGELHCHTVHSDGDSAVELVIGDALARGLDFLAITDHNAISHLAPMLAYQQTRQPAITLIPGCEMTTYYGHWNAWGLNDWVEFRVETPDDLRRAMREAARRGALVSCNHPRQYGPDWDFRDVTDFHCLEVWNGPWMLNNAEAMAYWHSLLRAGLRVPIVGGSDMHQLRGQFSQAIKLGTPTTWVYCPDMPTAPNILAALRRGHAYISETPSGPHIGLYVDGRMMGETVRPTPARQPIADVTISNGQGAVLAVVGSSGLLHEQPISGSQETHQFHIDPRTEKYVYIRVQEKTPSLDGKPILRAICNPVFFV